MVKRNQTICDYIYIERDIACDIKSYGVSHSKITYVKKKMEARGPSPLIPFLMLNVFAIIIFSPMVENLVVIPFLLMLVTHFLSFFFPSHQESSSSWSSYHHGGGASSHEGDSGFGFGTFLLVIICLILCQII
ncbi:hypothetical protein R6Q57_027880 [Mikania cordata]